MHGAQRATPTPSSTGSRNTTTIHDDCSSVFTKREKNSRRTATGVAMSSRRSSDRKSVESAVTTPLNARNERKVRNSHDKPDAQQKVAELVVGVELRGNPEGAPEQRREHEQGNPAEERRACNIGALAPPDAIA